jgi:polyisoprenoid-binding protein YceI
MSTLQTPTTTTWQVDPVHSTVGFAVKHMIVSTFRGTFERYEATLVDHAGRMSLTGWVDVDSLMVKDPNLQAHLASPEFFDSAQHPRLRFASNEITVGAGGDVVMHGELTVKGHTHPVRAIGHATEPLDDPFGGIRRGLELEATIDRRLYGLEWNLPLPKGGFALDNDVRLAINLEFTQA